MGKASKLTGRERDLLIAWYHAAGLSGTRIAELLHVDASEVSRRLGVLRDAHELTAPRLNISLTERLQVAALARNVDLERDLAGELGMTSGDRLWVVPAEPLGDPETHLDVVARQAAVKLLDYLLDRARMGKRVTIGVSWGRTVYHVVDEVGRLVDGLPQEQRSLLRESCQVFHLAGDTRFSKAAEEHGTTTLRHWASAVAAALAKALGECACTRFDLPGWLPVGVDDGVDTLGQRREQVLATFNLYPAFQEVYRAGGLLESADVLISSVGAIDHLREQLESTERLPGTVGPRSLMRTMFERDVVGDIAGVMLPRGGYCAGSPGPPGLALSFIGAELRTLQAVAQSAGRDGRMGVLAVASGATKAPAVLAAAKSGVVSHCVVDLLLAEAMLKAIPSDGVAPAGAASSSGRAL
ncbi:MAG: hypothetical protein HYU66_01695 [Armatimonadetes bacterium]|nr:hypothetical protein [Armatimonadota bacterium]